MRRCGWPEAIAAWTPPRSGTRGGQRRYSDLAIETALTLRLIYDLPLCQAEGVLNSLFAIMKIDLRAPDYTTLSRRGQRLKRRLRPVVTGEHIHLILDSTGLSIVGEGGWAALTHGDAAYDTVAIYDTAGTRGATVVVPPARPANVSRRGPRSRARDRTINRVRTLGRRPWKKVSGYHRQARVENTFFRYKVIISDGLRARSPGGQGSEAVLACKILNRMTAGRRRCTSSLMRLRLTSLATRSSSTNRLTQPVPPGSPPDVFLGVRNLA